LAALGGGLGVFLATQGLALLQATLPADTPRLAEGRIDWRVLAATAALARLPGTIIGMLPARRGARSGLGHGLRAGGSGPAADVPHRLRSVLVIAEIAMAVWLVIGAALLIRSVWSLSHVNPGFRAEHVVTTRLTPNASFCAEPARCLSFYREVLRQAQALPG